MAVPVIVITPSQGFGELIVQVLEETGDYALALANSSKTALELTKKDQPVLCILDSDLEDMPLNELVAEMRQLVDDLILIFIPGDLEQDDFMLDQIQADGYLSKPFYLPDLLLKVDETIKHAGLEGLRQVKAASLSQDTPESASLKQPLSLIEQAEAPDWLQDVSSAAQQLTRLSLEYSSQASLITRVDQVWAYAGELPQPAVEELAQTVSRYFSDGGNTDLARFIHLDATSGDYMLYATGLVGDFVLALLFDAEMPFSKIRSQANNLAADLTKSSDFSRIEAQANQVAEEEAEQFSKIPLLEDVPPPIPNGWVPEEVVSSERKGFLEELLQDEAAPIPPAFSIETNPAQQVVQPDRDAVEALLQGMQEDPEEGIGYDQVEEVFPQVPAAGLGDSTVVSHSDHQFDETMPSKSSKEKAAKAPLLEPVSSAVYSLPYACVLIPRIPEHHLTGDLTTHLSEWVTQLCLAFGWRLEQLSIRPDYIQWIVNVPPSTSPGYLMRIIRQHSSRRLFIEFPRLVEDNPSGDFWAPGYLIMSGTQDPPKQLVKDFIKDTRKRQGISK